MKKRQSITFLLLAFTTSFFVLYGQQTAGENFESVYVTTDRNIYFAGEDIWFSPLCLDGPNEISTRSKVVYLELLNTLNEPVAQTMVFLKDGQGDGNLTVPSYISSGFYVLRAYTNYMKNFGAESFFYKKLLLLNPVQGGQFNYPAQDDNKGDIGEISLYPEGDSVYQNLYNRVYIEFRHPLTPFNRKGWVVDQYYDTLSAIHFVRNDLAWFDFLPGTSKYYLSIPGFDRWAPVEINRRRGSLLKVESSFDQIEVSLESSDSIVKSSPLYLEITNVRDLPGKSPRKPFLSPMRIQTSTLEAGFSRFKLTDENGRNIAENYVYIRPGGQIKVNAATDKKTYGNREKATLTIQTGDASGNPVNTILTVCVRKKSGSLFNQYSLPGFLVIPEKFKALAADWDLDNPYEASAFLAIYGKEMFAEKDILPEMVYKPDQSGITVNGKLEKNGEPLTGAMVYLSVIGDSSILYPRITDNKGRFSFPVHDLQGDRDIVVKSNDTLRDAYFTIDDEYFPGFARLSHYPDDIDTTFSRTLNSLFYAWQVRRLYHIKDFRLINTCIGRYDFFGKPDFSIQMKDFVELPLLEEVFFEIVPPVMVLHRNKETYLKVIDKYTNRTIGDHPLYMVDGVPLFDPSVVMKIPPILIRDISVVQKQYFLGAEVFDGIIVIHTKNNDFSDVDFSGSYTRKITHFADHLFEFASPDYSDGRNSFDKPDFRNVLLWTPGVSTGPGGKVNLTFFTGDEDTDYEVVVEGLDAKGRSCYGTFNFGVGPKK